MIGTVSPPMRTAQTAGRLIASDYGAWLRGYQWDHVATLTFGEPVNVDTAQHHFRQWIRRLERSAQQRVDWYVAAERSCAGGWLHLHALVNRTAHLTVRELERAWQHGHTRITRYDPQCGAAYYVAKGMNTDPEWHDVSAKLTPRADTPPPDLVRCM